MQAGINVTLIFPVRPGIHQRDEISARFQSPIPTLGDCLGELARFNFFAEALLQDSLLCHGLLVALVVKAKRILGEVIVIASEGTGSRSSTDYFEFASSTLALQKRWISQCDKQRMVPVYFHYGLLAHVSAAHRQESAGMNIAVLIVLGMSLFNVKLAEELALNTSCQVVIVERCGDETVIHVLSTPSIRTTELEKLLPLIPHTRVSPVTSAAERSNILDRLSGIEDVA